MKEHLVSEHSKQQINKVGCTIDASTERERERKTRSDRGFLSSHRTVSLSIVQQRREGPGRCSDCEQTVLRSSGYHTHKLLW